MIQIDRIIEELEEGTVILDGLNTCIIGTSSKGNLIYSVSKIINNLRESGEMSYEDAFDYYYFNIECIGFPKDLIPPIFMNDFDEESDEEINGFEKNLGILWIGA